jgi:hypothetical protein
VTGRFSNPLAFCAVENPALTAQNKIQPASGLTARPIFLLTIETFIVIFAKIPKEHTPICLGWIFKD